MGSLGSMPFRVIRVGKRAFLFALLAALLTFGLSWDHHPVSATSIVVTTTEDEIDFDLECSLREAVIAANTDTAVSGCAAGSGADVITIPAGMYALSVDGAGEDEAAIGDLDVTESVTIMGAGIGSTIIDGPFADRVFDVAPLADGTVVINEIMIDPFASADASGEWVELFNPTGSDIDVNGWTLQDDDLDVHVISNGGPLLIPARDYLILARDDDPLANGGLIADYEYSSFVLANTGDEVVLKNPTGIEVDRVAYDGGSTYPNPTGASIALIAPRLDNNQGASWCASSDTFGDGDSGTPGTANDCPGDPSTGVAVTISGLTVQYGSSTAGAGIRNFGDLSLAAVEVVNNTGVGIYHLEGTFASTGSLIHDNTSSGLTSFHSSGPALPVTFDMTEVYDNGDGGIECINTHLIVTGGAIEGNGFGGVWGNGCAMEFDSTMIWGNSTPGDGGGIMSANYTPTLTNTIVGGNTAAGKGGGIYVWGLPAFEMNMTGGTIQDNVAQDGGGLYLDAGAATLDNVAVTTNHALDYGGGVYVNANNDATLTLLNGTAIGNSVNGNIADLDGDLTGSGGGIYNLGAVHMQDSSVGHNTGAGIDSFSPSGIGPSIMLERSEISNNSGSGISAINTNLVIEDSRIVSNEWGGIWAMGSPLTMTDSTVRENSTPGDGGGLALVNVSADQISGSTIEGNAAEGAGGGIYFWGLAMGGTLEISNSTISGNHADAHGGGIMVGSGTGSVLKMSGVTLAYNISDHDDTDDGDGGGIHNAAGALARLKHTLIAGNQDITSGAGVQWGQTCVGDLQSDNYNFIDRNAPAICAISGGSYDIVGDFYSPIDPVIGSLQWNGGITDTHALLKGSPAIEAGETGPCTDMDGAPFTQDQRGMVRPVGVNCDIGAYEAPLWHYLPLISR